MDIFRSVALCSCLVASLFDFILVTAFSGFLSQLLSENPDVDWKGVLVSVIGDDNEFKTLFRQAKRKVDETDNVAMCKTIFLDWMKAKPRQDDKASRSTSVLKQKTQVQ